MSAHYDDGEPRQSSRVRPGAAADAETGPGGASARGSEQRAAHDSTRRAELLGAAIAADLSPAEQREFDAMCAQDPKLAAELDALREFGDALRRGLGGTWKEESPPADAVSLEPLRFSDRGVEVDGVLITRTRGTEAVVEVEGLPNTGGFTLALVAAGGQEVETAPFLGADAPLECRIAWAVPREDVARLEIRDDAGVPVLAAELPDVEPA